MICEEVNVRYTNRGIISLRGRSEAVLDRPGYDVGNLVHRLFKRNHPVEQRTLGRRDEALPHRLAL